MARRKTLPEVGTKVKYTGRPAGKRAVAYVRDGVEYWLVGGAVGIVVGKPKGYGAHPCPNHDEYPDCVCYDESGVVSASEPCCTVEWEAENGGTLRRLIYADSEWELA